MSQSSAKEAPCPDCGEMVRVNSLRCWNCGAFMNPELEQKYMAMQANPAPIIFSEVPAGEMSSYEAEAGDDDDFELSMPVSRPAKPAADEAETYSLSKTVEEAPADEEAPPPAAKAKSAPAEPEVAHSVATGGDALLDIAMQEERDAKKRGKSRRQVGGFRTPGGGLLIFCPYGCKVEVKEQHRGMTGKCPRCSAPFIVPTDPPQYKKAEESLPAVAAAAATAAPGAIQVWLVDLHLHLVNPETLKLKADSLLKDFTEVDVGFSSENLLVAVLAKKAGGLFAKAGPKKEEARAALLEYTKDAKPLADAPAAEKYVFPRGDVDQLKVVQPAASRSNSIFHGVLVFGAGRIAVQLPETEQTKGFAYLSMGLTQFWTFAKGMETVYGIDGLGSDCGIPMAPRFSIYKCHYLETPIKALDDVEFFQADPTAELEVAGYRCGACKLTVSEAGRKKENLGGKSPKGIAKAKCPKCGSKMGEHLLYSLKADVVQPNMTGAGDSASE